MEKWGEWERGKRAHVCASCERRKKPATHVTSVFSNFASFSRIPILTRKGAVQTGRGLVAMQSMIRCVHQYNPPPPCEAESVFGECISNKTSAQSYAPECAKRDATKRPPQLQVGPKMWGNYMEEASSRLSSLANYVSCNHWNGAANLTHHQQPRGWFFLVR